MLLDRALDPVRCCKLLRFQFPHWLRKALAALALSQSSCGAPLSFSRICKSPTFAAHSRAWSALMRRCGGLGAIAVAAVSGEANSYWRKKLI
jgi:NAD-dependent oxidoreductase involved in siderophore biosynthesis